MIAPNFQNFSALDEAARFEAVHECVNRPAHEVRDNLVWVLAHDPSPLVRHEAAFLLGWFNDTAAVPQLIAALERDESFLVRHEAAVALGDLDHVEIEPALTRGLTDSNHEVRISCAVALRMIRKKSYATS